MLNPQKAHLIAYPPLLSTEQRRLILDEVQSVSDLAYVGSDVIHPKSRDVLVISLPVNFDGLGYVRLRTLGSI